MSMITTYWYFIKMNRLPGPGDYLPTQDYPDLETTLESEVITQDEIDEEWSHNRNLGVIHSHVLEKQSIHNESYPHLTETYTTEDKPLDQTVPGIDTARVSTVVTQREVYKHPFVTHTEIPLDSNTLKE